MDFNEVRIEDLQAFISSGQSQLPEPMLHYIDIIDTVRSMYQKYKSKAFIINYLVVKYSITKQYAGRLFVDSINFFYLDNGIKKEAWRNIYAEKLENSAQVAWELNDMETYARNIVRAAEMRGLDKEDPPALPEHFYDRRTIIYHNDVTKLNLPRANRAQLAEFIDNLPITETEKIDAKKDAGILTLNFMDYAEDQAE